MSKFNQEQQRLLREIVYYYTHTQKKSYSLCERLKYTYFTSKHGLGLILDMQQKRIYLAVKKGIKHDITEESCKLIGFCNLIKQLERENLLYLFQLEENRRVNDRFLCIQEEWSNYVYSSAYRINLKDEGSVKLCVGENLSILDSEDDELYELHEINIPYYDLERYVDDRNLYYVTSELINLVDNNFKTNSELSLEKSVQSIKIAQYSLWITCLSAIVSIIFSICELIKVESPIKIEASQFGELIDANNRVTGVLERYNNTMQEIVDNLKNNLLYLRDMNKSIKSIKNKKEKSSHVNISENVNSEIYIKNN